MAEKKTPETTYEGTNYEKPEKSHTKAETPKAAAKPKKVKPKAKTSKAKAKSAPKVK